MTLLFLPVLAGIGAFLTSSAGIGAMAVVGGGLMIGGAAKKKKMLKDQQAMAKKNLEEANKMRPPTLRANSELREANRLSTELIDQGKEQMKVGLNASERNLILNTLVGQNRFSDSTTTGSALKRIQQNQGVLQLGAAISKAKQAGAATYAQGVQSKSTTAQALQDVSNKRFAAEDQRYNLIQKAAGEGYASAQQNQFAQTNANMKLGASLFGMAVSPGAAAGAAAGGGGGDSAGWAVPNTATYDEGGSYTGGSLGSIMDPSIFGPAGPTSEVPQTGGN